MNISTVLTIWKREMKGYFYTPLAYVFVGIFSLLMGVMFILFLQSYITYTRGSMMGMGQTITVDRLLEAFYGNMHVILMFILPFFTMRLFTEESRQNTFVLLMTSPVTTLELAIAKILSGASMLAIKLAITLIFPAFVYIFSWSTPNARPDLGLLVMTYIGLFFCGLIYIGFGAFWSSITDSQLVAVVLAFATNFGFWLVSLAGQNGNGVFSEIFKYLAINEHFTSFSRGVPELKSLVYFLSATFLSIFLTHRSLESRSWRS
jgi:ABC-2 type transport system permease protein